MEDVSKCQETTKFIGKLEENNGATIFLSLKRIKILLQTCL